MRIRPLIKPSERLRQYQALAAWNRMAINFADSAAALRERVAYDVILGSRVGEREVRAKNVMFRSWLDAVKLAQPADE